jgi:hypothetical protein
MAYLVFVSGMELVVRLATELRQAQSVQVRKSLEIGSRRHDAGARGRALNRRTPRSQRRLKGDRPRRRTG